MEALIAGSLLGMGYLLNTDNERNFDENIKIPNQNKTKYTTNAYQSNYYNNATTIERQKVRKNTKKAKKAIDTNVIPHYFNQELINEQTTPVQFLQRPTADRTEAKAPVQNANDASIEGTIEEFYQPLIQPNTNKGPAFYSQLTGQQMESFTHENMVPFFRGTNKQNVDPFANQALMESFNGTNNFKMEKKAIEPMFKPQKDMGYVYGAPNKTEAVLDRYVPSIYRQSEVPVDPIRVGPGLNQGYTSQPTGGFQQFDAQEYALPKTVDELRTLDNPKISYEGRTAGAPGSIVQNRGLIGQVEKRLPDTFYIQTPERYLKTTGAYTKPEWKGKVCVKDTSRQNSMSYEGVAGPASTHVESLRPAIKKSTNNNYKQDWIRNANMDTYGAGTKYDYSKDSYFARPQERNEYEDHNVVTNLTTTVKAIIAPLLDAFRTTRKENVIGNPNKVGYMGRAAPPKPRVHDPNDVARTTIKETNIHNNHTGNMGTIVKKGTVHDPNDVARTTIKETNIHNNRTGNMKSVIKKGTVHDPNDVARTTIKETNIHNNRTGNMKSVVRKGTVHDPNDVAKTTIKETNIHNNRTGSVGTIKKIRVHDPNDIARTTIKETNIHNNRDGNLSRSTLQNGGGYETSSYDAPNTNRQFTSDYEYTGVADGQAQGGEGNGYLTASYDAPNTNRQFTGDYEYEGPAKDYLDKPMNEEMWDNARLNETKTGVSEGRYPTLSNTKVATGGKDINMEVKKLDSDRMNKYSPASSRIYTQTPSMGTCTVTTEKDQLPNASLAARIDPNMLTAFRDNPYTQPLDSAA